MINKLNGDVIKNYESYLGLLRLWSSNQDSHRVETDYNISFIMLLEEGKVTNYKSALIFMYSDRWVLLMLPVRQTVTLMKVKCSCVYLANSVTMYVNINSNL